MKRFIIMSLFTLLASGFLVSCGSTTVSEDTQNGGQTGSETGNNDVDEQEPDEDEPTDSSDSHSLTYTLNGESIEETAIMTKSDEQPFSIAVLPGYTLVAEEPGKDVLYADDHDEIFMRIEVLSDDMDWEYIQTQTVDQLSAVSDDITITESSEEVGIEAAVKFEASADGNTVTSIVKKGVYKVTMFTNPDQDYRDAFLQMAKTITVE